MTARFSRRTVLTVLTTLTLSACGRNGSTARNGAPNTMVLNRGNAGEPKSLDPQRIQTAWEINIADDLFTGLFATGANGKPVPGVAKSWTTTKDGMTWTFQLRDAVWSDGTPLTADDFVYAWRRMLDPKMAAEYASILYDFKNAQAVNGGKMPLAALGASAPDPHTLVLELGHPAPYLTELLTHVASFPIPRHVVEAKGAMWSRPENFVGNGAYVPTEWVPNDHITAVKNPHFFDAAKVAIDTVHYYPTVDYDAAIRRMRAGELDLQSQFSAQQIDWLRANMADALQMVPDFATYYVAMNQRRPPFTDKRIREAIALGIDREAIVNRLRRMGEPPAYAIVPPGMANYPGGAHFDFENLSMAARIAKAQARMRAAGYGPDRPLKTTYLTNTSTDNRILAPALQSMLRTIYIESEIVQADPQIAYARLHQGDFDLGYAAWVADYDDAYNFLGLLLTSDSGLNYQGYVNPAFDALMAKAQAEPDVKKRGALLLEGEKLALADYAMAPYRYSVTPDLVQPYVKGWIANPRDLNPTRWLRVAPHGEPG